MRKESAIKAVDKINFKFSNTGIHLAAEGIKKNWAMNSNYRSPKYTTEWSELPIIRI